MTEMKKTMTFVGVAVVVAAVALLARPRAVEYTPNKMIGKTLWEFDVQDAKRLQIVQFDEERAKLNEFEVAEAEEGKWTIPSKDGYPADAQDQMVDAATLVSGRKVLSVASVTAADHEQLGVVAPALSTLTVGARGVGIHMTIQDSGGEVLANAIIGEPVKDAEQQCYVRNADQDVTYIIEIDPSKLSTRFEDWIEKDLLKLNALDIQAVELRDYSLAQVLTTRGITAIKDNKNDMTDIVLSYDNTTSKWKADSIQIRPKGKEDYKDAPLAEDEELDDAKLNDLKSALQDLTIVNVERKPEGLSRDLQASEDFVRSEESVMSLVSRGFWPSIGADKKIDILSTDGEVIFTMKTGVEYVLRFGNLKSASSEEAADKTNGDDETDASKESLHRYLFVMARFNETAIEKPEIEDLPPLPTEDTAKPAKEASDEETETSEAESEVGEGKTSDTATNEEGTAEEEGDNTQSELEKAIEQRKATEKENQRTLDAYQDKIKEGKTSVKELNDRFGDWYYVIDDNVYKKIHLGRDEIVREKEKDEKGEDVDAAGFGKPGGSVPGLPNVPGTLK